jgi:hypothetical protein
MIPFKAQKRDCSLYLHINRTKNYLLTVKIPSVKLVAY